MTPQQFLNKKIITKDIVTFLTLKKHYSDFSVEQYKQLKNLKEKDIVEFLKLKFKKNYSDLTPQLYKTLSQQILNFEDKESFLQFKFKKVF